MNAPPRWWEGTPKPDVWPVIGGRYNLYSLWMDGSGPRHAQITGGGYETLEQARAQAAWQNEKWPQLDCQVLDHQTGEISPATG